MSNGLITNEFSVKSVPAEYRGQIGAVAEENRAIATIQAALTVAAARPRDEKQSMDRILNACQRVGLAEKAEYSFSRGGQDIIGATIDLMTVIANCWGNIDFGFRELSQQNGESTVECFAWDLETNSKRTVVFTVPHARFARGQLNKLKDPRDIYELVANQAQRRVRACLEAIIPPDVVEAARMQCSETLHAKDPVTPEKVMKLVESFGKEFKVTKEQIEKRIQRRVDAITSAQMIAMKRIWRSLKEGMSQPSDWFPPETEEPAKGVEGLKEKLASKEQPVKKAKANPEPKKEDTVATDFREQMQAAASIGGLNQLKREILGCELGGEVKSDLLDAVESRIAEVEAEAEAEQGAE